MGRFIYCSFDPVTFDPTLLVKDDDHTVTYVWEQMKEFELHVGDMMMGMDQKILHFDGEDWVEKLCS